MFTFKPFAGAIILLLMISSCKNANSKLAENNSSADKTTNAIIAIPDEKKSTEDLKEIPVNNGFTQTDSTTQTTPLLHRCLRSHS